jgi:hypothetical protein
MSAKKTTRRKRRDPGKTQTSISLRVDLLDRTNAKAEADGRSFSNWVEQLLQNELDSNDSGLKSA